MANRKRQKDKQRSTHRKLKSYPHEPHSDSLDGYVVPAPLVATIVLLWLPVISHA
jgi:hypothetical protein